jgi:hypothetical protein
VDTRVDLLESLEQDAAAKSMLAMLARPAGALSIDQIISSENTEAAIGLEIKIARPYASSDTAALADCVVRQSKFVEKMNGQLWIRSPAVAGTLERAGTRYKGFLKLFKLYKSTMLVPTLDIDLVWHTHQCSPAEYFASTKKIAGRFINHDDTIEQSHLDKGSATTEELYKIRVGKEYHICTCWECEATLSAVEKLDTFAATETDMEQLSQKVVDDVMYYKAVELARRDKKKLPKRQSAVR